MMCVCRTFHECFPLDELSEGALEDLQNEMNRMFEVQRFSALGRLLLTHIHLRTGFSKTFEEPNKVSS